MSLYNLRSNPSSQLPYTITKFDNDLNPESVYFLGTTVCECPAGHLPKCRHRTMLPTLVERVDTSWFWCFETQTWEDPTGAAKINDEAEPLPEVEEELENDGDIPDTGEEPATPIEVEAKVEAPLGVGQASSRGPQPFKRRL